MSNETTTVAAQAAVTAEDVKAAEDRISEAMALIQEPAKRRLTISVEIEVPRSSYSWDSEMKAEYSTEGKLDAGTILVLLDVFTKQLGNQILKEVV